MKNQSLILTLSGLTCLIWASNSFAIGDAKSVPTPSTQTAAEEDLGLPWFTGPLLAGAGNTVPEGHIDIEPYLFSTKAYGFYNSDRKAIGFDDNFYTLSPTWLMTLGVTSFMDIQAVIPYVYNDTAERTNSDIGDSTVTLGFQLLRNVTDTWRPSIRATVGETFPTGNYENLDPNSKGTDATGAGAYQTNFGLNFQHLWHVGTNHYFRDRLSLGYTLPSTSDIRGVSAFGGTNQTSGKEKLGSQFSADLAMEYTLTEHWVPALDILYSASDSSTFTGEAGTNSEGLPAIENGPSGDSLSLAPAIEYNFNSHVGIIAGPWFTVAGRNSTQFISGVIAVNYFQ